MVPSSARSASAAATPLPAHLVPLLGSVVDAAHDVCRRILPQKEKRSALEEALWEVDPTALGAMPSIAAETPAGALERELLQQSFEKARVYRPRLLLHGPAGMGQATAAAALLHRLEGYNVQTIAVASLLGDSSQTPESSLVQQFNEARRLKPSVLLVPELDRWPVLLSESVREAFCALLDTLKPEDPVMLLGVASVPFDELPSEIRAWFGILPLHRVAIPTPPEDARAAYLGDIARQAARPPSQFADGLPRRKRVLDELPKAPPQPPRQPTQIELSQQTESDARLLEHLKFRLGPVLAELRKKFKKFTRDVWDEYNLRELMAQFDWRREKGKVVVTLRYDKSDQLVGASSDEGEDAPADVDGGDQDAHESVDEDADEGADEDADGAPHAAADEPVAEPADAPADAPTDAPEAPAGAPVPEPAHAHLADTDMAPVDEAPAPAASAEAPAAKANDDSPYILREFTIYTMTLEKMQKRLYYNGYLTCDAFMDDINKIVSNAEEAREVDADRVFRARQMQNLATILLDQYIDAPFRAECERMAQRVLAREEEAKRTAELQKAGEVHSRRPNGQRYSARKQVEAPGPNDFVDVSTIERAHKRVRSTSAPADAPEEPEEEAPKRPRTDDEPVADAAPPPVAPAVPALPDMVLSTAAQDELVAMLVRTTTGFSIEQLEQTRAACYDAILAHRTAWDRQPLLAELHTIAHALHEAVHGRSA